MLVVCKASLLTVECVTIRMNVKAKYRRTRNADTLSFGKWNMDLQVWSNLSKCYCYWCNMMDWPKRICSHKKSHKSNSCTIRNTLILASNILQFILIFIYYNLLKYYGIHFTEHFGLQSHIHKNMKSVTTHGGHKIKETHFVLAGKINLILRSSAYKLFASNSENVFVSGIQHNCISTRDKTLCALSQLF